MTDITYITESDVTGLGRIVVDGKFYGVPVKAVAIIKLEAEALRQQLADMKETMVKHGHVNLFRQNRIEELEQQLADKDEINAEWVNNLAKQLIESQERERGLVDKANGYLIENARLTEQLAALNQPVPLSEWQKMEQQLAECQKQHELVTSWLNPTRQQLLECQARVQEPEGWKLVPIEPTSEMISAIAFDPACATPSRRHIYRAMISSAPKFKAKEAE